MNDRRTLPLAIQSVFSQTREDWLLILVDDGSSDGSLEFARTIADPRVSVQSDGRNAGLPSRLNTVAAIARTPYLARMDADDVMHPRRLEEQLRVLEGDQTVDLVVTAAYSLDINDRIYGLRSARPLPGTIAGLLDNDVIIHPTVTGRREWFLSYPYDPLLRKAQDKELWLRAIPSSKVVKLLHPLLYYREAGAFSMTAYRETRRMERAIVRRYAPALVGTARATAIMLRIWLKEATYRLLAPIGAHHLLVRRRTGRATVESLAEGQQALEQVRRTTLPFRVGH